MPTGTGRLHAADNQLLMKTGRQHGAEERAGALEAADEVPDGGSAIYRLCVLGKSLNLTELKVFPLN